MNVQRDRVYVQHILDAIDRIETYIGTMERVEFEDSPLLQDGVIRQLQIIGEAVKRLSSEFRQEVPTIPWVEVAGMRDKLVHDYFGVDIGTVWETVVRDLPKLKRELRRSPYRNH